jgi:hypothetical protein
MIDHVGMKGVPCPFSHLNPCARYPHYFGALGVVTFFRHPYDAERGAFIRTGVGRPEHACHVEDLYLLMGR